MKLFFYIKIMIAIISHKFLLKNIFFDKLINIALWALISLFVTSYILPKMGLTENFGLIQFAGIMATIGLFEAYGTALPFLADLEGRQTIYHRLGYPVSAFSLFISEVIANAISYSILTFAMIPISKCLLWNMINLFDFNWFYLVTIIIIANIFFSAMSLFIVSFISHISKISNAWSRFIFPIWFMGGFQFSWKLLYETNKIIAYIDLLNPLIYINEAFKIAILKETGICSFLLCILIIIIFTILVFFIGYKRLQKRLDFI